MISFRVIRSVRVSNTLSSVFFPMTQSISQCPNSVFSLMVSGRFSMLSPLDAYVFYSKIFSFVCVLLFPADRYFYCNFSILCITVQSINTYHFFPFKDTCFQCLCSGCSKRAFPFSLFPLHSVKMLRKN